MQNPIRKLRLRSGIDYHRSFNPPPFFRCDFREAIPWPANRRFVLPSARWPAYL